MNWFFRSSLIAFLGIAQCTSSAPSKEHIRPNGPRYEPNTVAATPISNHEEERRECEARLREILQTSGLPGAVGFDERRLEILTRAKAEPVVLTETPRFRDREPVTAQVAGYRTLLSRTEHAWDALENLLPVFEKRPRIGRQTLLRDGYLFAEDPQMAYALVGLVSAEHLFGHDKIWIKRGERTYHAKRVKGRYVFVDGPNEGEPVRLLLLDRIGHGKAPQDTITRDLRSLRYRLHFNRAKIRHVTESHIIANLRYGDLWVPSILRAEGAHLELECEIVTESLSDEVAKAKAEAARRSLMTQALRSSMQEQIRDQLPFDEPRREFGFQLDGRLRGNWLHAYLDGKSSYAFNGDRYFVFNGRGNPLLPQVCVDFLTDTLERASGSWWAPKGQPRKRLVGKLDYQPMNVVERAKLRRVPGFLQYTRDNPNHFQILDVEKRDRVPLGERSRMIDFLRENSDDYQPGDIVVIRGEVPWDPLELHYHSFFIYESDPLSGIPLALVGNAGRPSVRYWEVEARRTPKREIWHRIRPTTAWLESIVIDDGAIARDPPPVSPLGNAG